MGFRFGLGISYRRLVHRVPSPSRCTELTESAALSSSSRINVETLLRNLVPLLGFLI